MNREMICCCDSLSHQEAENIRLEVQRRLGVKASDLAVSVLLSLAWQFNQDIDVAADLWFGVYIKDQTVECDFPLDGMIWLWKTLADKMDNDSIISGLFKDNTETVELSKKQFAEYQKATNLYDQHICNCNQCDIKYPSFKLCVEGKKLDKDESTISKLIIDKWGPPKYEEAPRYWGEYRKDLDE